MIRIFFVFVLLLCTSHIFAQTDSLNQLNEKGLRTGYWIFYGKDMPEKGYPENGKIEEGVYLDNRKHGRWIKYHKDGKTPRLIGEYVAGRPNGTYRKYAENGQLIEQGTFRRRMMVDSLKRWYPCGKIKSISFYDEEGKKHGDVISYRNTCNCSDTLPQLVDIQSYYKHGVIAGSTRQYYPSSCLKRVVWYGNDGKVVDSESYADSCATHLSDEQLACIQPPLPEKSKVTYPSGFNPDGYNSVYNERYLLWMRGDFEKGKLVNGKVYLYDQDDILLKVEIFTNGKYAKDTLVSENINFDECDSSILYDKEGNLVWDGNCVDGNYWTGKKYVYDEDGILLKVEIWKNGRHFGDGKL